MCMCGHSINEHLGGGGRQCLECDCMKYEREEDSPDDFDLWLGGL